jgi:uncharacterized membrane protein YeaQ/YmgE (transglycosylase-associated protein family)
MSIIAWIILGLVAGLVTGRSGKSSRSAHR